VAKYFLQLGLSIVLVVLIFVVSGVRPSEIWVAVAKVDVVLLLPIVFAIIVFDRVLMSYKWNILLRSRGIDISLFTNIRIYWTATFIGSALPSTIGADIVRTYTLATSNHDASKVLGSVVVERILGFGAVALMALLFLPFAAAQHAELWIAMGIVALSLVGMVFLCFILLNPTLTSWIRRPISRLIGERLAALSADIYRGFADFKDRPDVLFVFFLLTLLETLIPVILAVILARSLGIQEGWIMLAALVPLVLFIIRLPIALSGIGVIEWSYVYLYGIIGMSRHEALSLGILMDVVGIVITLIGAVFLIPFNRKSGKALKT